MREKYGGLEVFDARRLRELESEKVKLKRLLADTMLDNVALKDLLSKKRRRPLRRGKRSLIGVSGDERAAGVPCLRCR